MTSGTSPSCPSGVRYRLDDQVGFILRLVAQRHHAIFAGGIGADLTPTQWAALAKLAEAGPLSQNLLGRQTAMDAATIKGVVDRLARRNLVSIRQERPGGRRLTVALTDEGQALHADTVTRALRITEATLAPLDDAERESVMRLLARLR